MTTASLPTPRGSGVPARHARRLVGAASLAAGAVLWEVYARAQENNLLIPGVSEVVVSLWEQVQTAEFWDAYRQTLIPFAYGWLGALLVGVTVGLLVGLSPVLRGLVAPYFAFFNSVPLSTFLPILVIALGIGLPSRIAVVFLFAVIDVVFTTASGVAYVDRDLLAMARSFGMSRRRRFVRVVLPGALPGIISAIRLGTGRAILGMIVMELLLVSVGVGRLVTRYRDTFQSAELYAVLISLAIFGLSLLGLVRQLEKRALKGRPRTYGAEA